jgi:hypothetical protein
MQNLSYLAHLMENTQPFFDVLPEMGNGKLFMRHHDSEKKLNEQNLMGTVLEIEIGIDIPDTQESFVLIKESYIRNDNDLGMTDLEILDQIASKIIIDNFRFAMAQQVVMRRKAALESSVLVDKPMVGQ